jgi:hypothetical protein
MSFNARLDAIEKKRAGDGRRRVVVSPSPHGRGISRTGDVLTLDVPLEFWPDPMAGLDDAQRAMLRPDDDVSTFAFVPADPADPPPWGFR